MELEVEKVEQEKEKQPYETPQVTKHGSVEQLTGVDGPVGRSSVAN